MLSCLPSEVNCDQGYMDGDSVALCRSTGLSRSYPKANFRTQTYKEGKQEDHWYINWYCLCYSSCNIGASSSEYMAKSIFYFLNSFIHSRYRWIFLFTDSGWVMVKMRKGPELISESSQVVWCKAWFYLYQLICNGVNIFCNKLEFMNHKVFQRLTQFWFIWSGTCYRPCSYSDCN